MGIRIVTQPSCEPVTLNEARLYLRMPDAFHEDDETIEQLITAARQHVEGRLRRQLVQATLEHTLDAFPVARLTADSPHYQRAGGIRLPNPPLLDVLTIEYVDGAGTTQTLASTAYVVDTTCEPGVVMPAFNQSWPVCRDQPSAVTITYRAGHRPTVDTTLTVTGTGDVPDGTYTQSGDDYYDTANHVILWDAVLSAWKLTSTGEGPPPPYWAGGTDPSVPTGSYTANVASGASGTATVALGTVTTDAHKQAAVPAAIKLAIKMLVLHWYDPGKAPVNIGNIVNEVEHTLSAILAMQGYGSYSE